MPGGDFLKELYEKFAVDLNCLFEEDVRFLTNSKGQVQDVLAKIKNHVEELEKSYEEE